MAVFDEKEQEKKLAELRKKEEEQLASMLSRKYNLEYIDLSTVSINTDALRVISEEEARKAEVAAFSKVGKKLAVAVRTPNNPNIQSLKDELERKGYSLTLYMASRASLKRAWELYKDLSFAVETREGVLEISGDEIDRILKNIKTLNDARIEVEEVLGMKKAHRISRILETVLAGALAKKASDVHIEPEENETRLRYRLDGVLTDVINFDHETYRLLLSRIKLLSGLKLNVKDEAQDGRFSVEIANEEIEVRTSILPGSYGESIVLRLLHPETLAVPMEELGIERRLLDILEREIKKPNGMILTTGPTGSGKTTTLYAFLKQVHQPEIKIITIEDPVEYHLQGIVQTQTDSKNYTFAKGLRSSLRQDPDIIMVGEIRDSEVVETAVDASLTGHLVFSTLHTNNAAGAIPRLIDLGANPRVLSSSINVIIAQRLVRKLKKGCTKEVELGGEAKKFVDETLATIPDPALIPENRTKVWEPVVNENCESGYEGRIGLFEAIVMDTEIGKLAEQSASEEEIAEASKAQGILTMKQDGVLKALRGITSLSELDRVLDIGI
ncbi:MAG: GspE/PulE family protein [Candidatus Paceibacterota bacterium]